MVIKIGENPEDAEGINKFIARDEGDGVRGKIIAMHKSQRRAIILAMNSSCGNEIEWGKLYEVVEKDEKLYPITERVVDFIPNSKEWAIV